MEAPLRASGSLPLIPGMWEKGKAGVCPSYAEAR